MKKRHLEMERKFLPQNLPGNLKNLPHQEIAQGYLVIGIDRSHVRLRRKGRVYSLTFKRGPARAREEREIRLQRAQFEILWPPTAGFRLTKTRYDIRWKNSLIELDVYHGSNEGLVVAEVEFADVKSYRSFRPPAWLGKEVTGVRHYSNVKLARD
jgi:adenylate cyclase